MSSSPLRPQRRWSAGPTHFPRSKTLTRIDKLAWNPTQSLMALSVKTRNVSLTPHLEAFISARVASGRYRSASELVGAALRLLEEEEDESVMGKRAEPGHPQPSQTSIGSKT
jgi:putative addiction module CopG family antidote